MSDANDSSQRAAEFAAMFHKGAELTRELIEENRRLRRAVSEIQDRQTVAAQSNDEWGKLRSELLERIQGLESERQDALERLNEVERENQQFLSRFLEVEEENNNLANLYISSYQLHSTLDLSETLRTILEIVINLIGADRFAVFVADETSQTLEAVACEGGELEEFAPLRLGEGSVGSSLAAGEVVYPRPPTAANGEEPIVCIPLRLQEHLVGAIAVYRLLQQKECFSALDHELFTLLAGHAATAIFACRLYGQSERKRHTIQGFLDLLTK